MPDQSSGATICPGMHFAHCRTGATGANSVGQHHALALSRLCAARSAGRQYLQGYQVVGTDVKWGRMMITRQQLLPRRNENHCWTPLHTTIHLPDAWCHRRRNLRAETSTWQCINKSVYRPQPDTLKCPAFTPTTKAPLAPPCLTLYPTFQAHQAQTIKLRTGRCTLSHSFPAWSTQSQPRTISSQLDHPYPFPIWSQFAQPV